jgi:hypothetical protein
MAEWTRAKGCSANSCIEVRRGTGPYPMVEIRSADEDDEIYVQATPDEWAAFVAGVRAGDFDHITEEAAG